MGDGKEKKEKRAMSRSIRLTLLAGFATASALAFSMAAGGPVTAGERRVPPAVHRFNTGFFGMYDYVGSDPYTPCRIVDAISHRCLTFHSDSTWPQGLPDFNGSNGG